MTEAEDPIPNDERAAIGSFGSTLSGGWDITFRLCGPCWSEVSQIPTPLLKEYEVGYLYTRILCDPPQYIRIAFSSPLRHKM